MRVLCFDVGGTFIKYGIVETGNENLVINKIKTRKDKNNNYILEDILNIIEENISNEIDVVAVATAGVVDNKKGEVVYAGPTIPNYKGTKIKETIEKKFGIPCVVENDVNAAALGETKYSNLDGLVFMITIGTGVGGSIILNGEIFTGSNYSAGEIGYLNMKGTTYQKISSMSYLTTKTSEKVGKEVDGKYIFENAKKGDNVYIEEIDEMVENLSLGLLSSIYILNPSHIIIGGAVSAQGDYLKDKIVKAIKDKIQNERFMPNIRMAVLENKAGIYGMMELAKKEYIKRNDFYIF